MMVNSRNNILFLHDYNIRGWQLGKYRDYVKDISTANYFDFDLGYDKNGVLGTFAKQQYNGNISGTIWKSKGDGEIRKYDFSYDAVNRILSADFNQYTGSSFSKTAGVDFSMTGMGYDANGNILTMNQKGLKINTSPQIDQLTYSYETNSNKLKQVTDGVNDENTALGDFHYDPATKGSTDYTYDANSNLTADANKKISSISYNYLNLPSVITVTGKGTITYTYDAAGNKLRKVTVDNTVSPAKTTTTLYLGGAVYENDELQFIAHEEGRIRPVRDANETITGFTYDYFLKDHLGNVRMVLTDEQKQDAYPPASMETAQAAIEEALYDNISETKVNKPAGYPTDNYTNPNDKVAKVDGNGNKIGPSIILKVMAGDSYNLRASSWYKTGGASPASPNSMAVDLIASFFSSLAGIPGYTHGSAALTVLENSGVVPTALNSFLGSQPAPGSTKPKAYLNWILLDEQFQFVEGSSGAEQVGSDQEFKVHTKTDLSITKNGYLYVFVSNETPNINVYFDNLQITHTRGPILEEAHYYPFGLTMAGISSKALKFGGAENRFKYNGKELQSKEFSNNSGLDLYDFGARMQDPQLGRWWVQDAKADKYVHASPYNYALNNPTNCVDPDGKLVIFVNGYWNRLLNLFGAAPGAGKEKYWNFFDTKFIGAARNFLGATENEKNQFIDGSSLFGGDQSGSDRYALGKEYAKEHYEEIVAGLADGETIKFIGHSEGAAFAAGMADYISKRFGANDGRNNPVETALYLSPDEADEFSTSARFKTYEAYFSDDWVSPAHHIKGVDYEIKFKEGGKQYAHGKTVSAKTLDRLNEIVNLVIGSGDFTVTETSDAIIYNRKGGN